jgi:capsular polysaccharide export protein
MYLESTTDELNIPSDHGTVNAGAPQRKQRVYLFLQGHPSTFWRELFQELRKRRAECLKVNLCLGDSVYWLGAPSVSYRGSLHDWPIWLREYCSRMGVTDILYYADQQPYHRAARSVAHELAISCWAVEFGYLRPDWLTFEKDGMGPLSHFPRDPARIQALSEGLARPDLRPRYLHSFLQEAANEVSFNLLTMFGRLFFPRYQSDKLLSPLLEYIGWLPLFIFSRFISNQAEKIEDTLRKSTAPYNLVALQMRHDYQVRAASSFFDLTEFVDDVIRSFSAHAPQDRQLILKIHPRESGYHMWGLKIKHIARKYGVKDRIKIIRGADLQQLLLGSEGVVLVNSTVGMHALRLGIPVCALGEAIYNVPGLIHDGDLDLFWTNPQQVDIALFEAFERALTTVQVKGSFFDAKGRHRAIAEIATRLEKTTM